MSVVQIAAEAGVSIATVSRVLNNSRRVNPKLAEQVHRAMVTLNFQPEQIRRKTTRKPEQQASTIAIISLGQTYRGWFEIPVIAAVVAEIMRCAQDHHLGTFITEMPDPAELSPALRRQPVDGALVFMNSGLTPKDAAVLAGHLPIVRVMGGQFAQLTIDHVGPDNSSVGHVAGQYLLGQGCRELAYLTTRPSWDMSKLRGQGFASATLAAGVCPLVFLEGDDPQYDCVFGARTELSPDLAGMVAKLAVAIRNRANPDAPMGVFVSRDEETMFVYRLLAEHGLVPGRDLIIVSCDNERVRISALSPQPASVDLNAAQIARHGVERLIDRMRRPDEPPVRLLVNPTLAMPSRA